MKIPVLVSCLLLAVSPVAQGQTQVVDLSTCIAAGGGLANVGSADLRWQVELPGGSTFQPVRCTSGSLMDSWGAIHTNVWASDPQARWLSPYVDSLGNATDTGAAGDFVYRRTFVAPDCTASRVLASFAKLGGDNEVTKLTVNGHPHPLGVSVTFSPLTSLSVNIPPGEIVAGTTNTVDITVNNWSSYTGLLVDGNLTLTYPDCPTAGVNKDLRNTTGQPADDIEILLSGTYASIDHYDGYPANLFATFTASTSGGNTLLHWSNPNNPVQPGQIAHVGYSLLGTSAAPILGVSWTLHGTRTGCAQQVSTNTHLWGSPGSQVVYVNDVLDCRSEPRYVGGLVVEWHARRVPLVDLNGRTRRKPLRTDVIRRPPIRLEPGATARVDVPKAPPNATFGVVVHKVSGNARLAGPDVTTDFLEFPVQRKAHEPPPRPRSSGPRSRTEG